MNHDAWEALHREHRPDRTVTAVDILTEMADAKEAAK